MEADEQSKREWYNSILDTLHQSAKPGDYLLELLTGVGGMTMEIKEKVEGTETVEINPNRLSFVNLGTKISLCIADNSQPDLEENEKFMRLLDLKPFVHAQLALGLNLQIQDYFNHRCYSPEYLADKLTAFMKKVEGFVKIEWDGVFVHSMVMKVDGKEIA